MSAEGHAGAYADESLASGEVQRSGVFKSDGTHRRALPVVRSRAYDAICQALAVVLLIAAGLKAYSVETNADIDQAYWASPAAQLAVIEIEGWFALWLITAKRSFASHVVAVVFFSVLCLVAVQRAFMGHATCGCLGALHLPPWAAVSFDFSAIVLLLFLGRGIRLHGGASRPLVLVTQGFIGQITISCIAMLLVGFGVTLALFGSSAAALAWISGSRLDITPQIVDLGVCERGERRTVEICVINHEDEVANIVGARATCNCIAVGPLPLAIPAKESRIVPIEIAVTGRGDVFQQVVTLYRGGPWLVALHARVVARVTSNGQDSRSAVMGKRP